jgi:hypothetical protein
LTPIVRCRRVSVDGDDERVIAVENLESEKTGLHTSQIMGEIGHHRTSC